MCRWVLESFATVDEAKAELPKVAIWGAGPDVALTHWVVRDASGASLVLEFPDGTLHAHDDPNDGVRGWGIMTNEPPFEYHLAAAVHLGWKRTLARQAVPVPGSWYPEERFLRVLMVKETMQPPASTQQAVAQAVGVLNTVTVPMGAPPGTDSDADGADHSLFGVVRDHASSILYWRSAANPSLQRLRLADVDFSPGAPVRSIAVDGGLWFRDASFS